MKINKRFQVFISSTFNDLKEERRAIIESLLNAKYIPAGMEIFSASSDEQFNYIKKIIDDCDYYILILKNNYGSISASTGISYTEMEYDYAIKRKIPILAFIYANLENIQINGKEKKNRVLFWNFRDRILKTNRLCKMWNSSLELIPSVIGSLNEEVQTNPQIGWIRPDIYEQYYLVEEIYKLREKKVEIENVIEILNKRKYGIFDFNKMDSNLLVHGIRFDSIRKREGKGHVSVNIHDLFQKISKELECIKTLSEMKIIITEGINTVCGSCFDYIENDDMNKVISFFCNTNYIRCVLNNGEEYFGLSLMGKEYSNLGNT